MKLKKINENLCKALVENNLTEANTIQETTFSSIKSGADCLIISPKKSGKTTTIVINVIQQLIGKSEASPRALIMVENKSKVIEILNLFDTYTKYTDLRVYGVHDKGNTDFDKNYISTGIDVLVGTPNKLNDLFSGAGYNINRLKLFILDDANLILNLRHETKIQRISDSIAKTQRIIFSEKFTKQVSLLAEKILVAPYEFNFEG